jgi:alcohol dehydrogenase class IV
MAENERALGFYSVPMLRMPKLILFGYDTIQGIGKEAKRLGGTKALIVTDRSLVKLGLVENARQPMEKESIQVDLFEEIEYEPTLEIIGKAVESAKKHRSDIVVGFGGGSAMDAAKAVAGVATNEGNVADYVGRNKIPKAGLPCILVPTTSGTGAEVNSGCVVTDEKDGNKKSLNDTKLMAEVCIVDPLLTVNLPPKLTAYTGVDAFCHALGAYISKKSNPVCDGIAMEAIRLISGSLRRAVANGEKDIEARYDMALGATIGMIARVNSGGGAVHGLSYPLGTKYHLPHGHCISLLIPWVMEYNVDSAVGKFIRVAQVMGERTEGLEEIKAAERAIEAIKTLLKDIGIFQRLREIGVKKEEFPEFADIVYQHSPRHVEANPKFLTKEDIVKIFENAW